MRAVQARAPAPGAGVIYAAGAIALALAALFCMLFVDRPVALFMAAHQQLRPLFQACAVPSLLALPVSGVVLLVALAQRLRGRPGPGWDWMALALATLAATAAKDELKWMFGRAWPETWLKYGLYQFRPFTDSILFGGFPSGHTAYISAPMAVLWVLRPRGRLLWAAVVLAVMAGLVLADYHFVSDVLGGLITGGLCAWGTLVLLGKRYG